MEQLKCLRYFKFGLLLKDFNNHTEDNKHKFSLSIFDLIVKNHHKIKSRTINSSQCISPVSANPVYLTKYLTIFSSNRKQIAPSHPFNTCNLKSNMITKFQSEASKGQIRVPPAPPLRAWNPQYLSVFVRNHACVSVTHTNIKFVCVHFDTLCKMVGKARLVSRSFDLGTWKLFLKIKFGKCVIRL